MIGKAQAGRVNPAHGHLGDSSAVGTDPTVKKGLAVPMPACDLVPWGPVEAGEGRVLRDSEVKQTFYLSLEWCIIKTHLNYFIALPFNLYLFNPHSKSLSPSLVSLSQTETICLIHLRQL